MKKIGGLRSKNIFKYSKLNNPLITIITVVKNNKAYFEQTIKSISRQVYKNFELIVIVGFLKKTMEYMTLLTKVYCSQEVI